MMCQRMGMPPTSIIGFGRREVSSPRRVPSPPARITACTRTSSNERLDAYGAPERRKIVLGCNWRCAKVLAPEARHRAWLHLCRPRIDLKEKGRTLRPAPEASRCRRFIRVRHAALEAAAAAGEA